MKLKAIQVEGDSGKVYTILPHASGGAYCTCPSWKFRNPGGTTNIRSCKHIEYAFELLAQSALASA